MTELTDKQKEVLSENYKYWLDEENGRWAAIDTGLIYTVAIIDGPYRDAETGYQRRWCYNNAVDALSALAEWGGRKFEGEPEGWHRSVHDGRRRPHGKAEEEYVNW